TRIEIDAETDAAAVLAEMLDGEPQSPRAGRAEHQPVGPLWKVLLRQRVAEHLVVDPVVFDDDAALGDPGGAAGLEDIDRLVLQRFRHPTPHWSAAQPVVLEEAELLQIVEALHLFARIEAEALSLLQPKRRASFGIEMPRHDLADVGVKA